MMPTHDVRGNCSSDIAALSFGLRTTAMTMPTRKSAFCQEKRGVSGAISAMSMSITATEIQV